MKTIELSFKENPAYFTASFIVESGFNPVKTLIISPSQRFKSYFASYLLRARKTGDLLSPSLITSDQLVGAIAASPGCQIANDIEKLSMLFTACGKTEGIEEFFPIGFLSGFISFKSTARRIFNVFDELNREGLYPDEIDPLRDEFKAFYSHFKRHFKVIRDLYQSYFKIQKESGLFDRSFLFKGVKKKDIDSVFNDYENLILVSPLALTDFEKKLFDTVQEKLYVIYQDTAGYDFSEILSYSKRGATSANSAASTSSTVSANSAASTSSTVSANSAAVTRDKKKKLHYFEVSSRIAQVMSVLSIIKQEIEAGTGLHEIAILNIDSVFSEMLYDSMTSHGLTVNYSEGIPVKKSPIYCFLSLINSFFKSDRDSRIFLEIIRNALFREAAGKTEASSDLVKMKNEILKERVFHISSFTGSLFSDDKKILESFSLLERLYMSENFDALYNNLEELFSCLSQRKTYEFYIVKEILLNAAVELSDFELYVKEKPFEIFLEHTGSKRHPLLGSYDKGVQIIGLLESRAITFKSVVVPSFNEGFLPVKMDNDILLSLSLRKALGLPTFLEREALEFYYLKRIVDSAGSVYLVSIVDKTGKIDVKSRFYYHLADEINGDAGGRVPFLLPVRTGFHRVKRPEAVYPNLDSPVFEFSRLDLDRIKKCETSYYIARILGIGEEEILTRKIEMRLVGLKVHAIFKELYRDLDLKKGTRDIQIYQRKLSEIFDKQFKDGTFYTKEELLLKTILKNNLIQALKRDFSRFYDGYRVCREYMEREFTAVIGTGINRYTLKGRIDRIDRSPSGGYIIIDYKTGKLPKKASHFEANEFSEVQLGFYGLLFKKNYPDFRIEALGYFDLLDKKDFETVIGFDDMESYLTGFEDHLVNFFESFNRKEPLTLTENYENCRYCPYFNICRVLEE